jgi:hypothetical protein
MKAASSAAPIWTLLFWLVAIVAIVIAVGFVGFSMLSQFWVDTVHSVTLRVTEHTESQRAQN